MFSKEAITKFNYRIVIGKNADRPYEIEKKGWFFWNYVSRESSLDMAKSEIQRLIRHEYRKPGTVVFEYNHEDHLSETLKGSR